MANNYYKDWRDYFEELAINNIAISHVPDTDNKKKFFEVMLEEIISGITHKLPGKEEGPFILFVGYLDRFMFNDSSKKSKEIMFFVMQSAGTKDYQQQSISKDNCERVVDQFIIKMNKDSKDDHSLFENSFDKINNVSIISHEFKIGTITYVGWQVSIALTVLFDNCYDPLKWKP
jgi:hypothetical protein